MIDAWRDRLRSEALRWDVLAWLAALVAGFAVRAAVKASWTAWRGEAPPNDPTAADVTWRDAMLWGAVTGVTVGLMRVVARRTVGVQRRRHHDRVLTGTRR